MNTDRIMTAFSNGVLRYRWFWLALIVVATCFLVYTTKNLTVNNDYDTWLPGNDKISELYRLVDKQFAANFLVFGVLDFTEKGVFHPESLSLVQRMTNALEGIDELFNVSSLTNIVDIRKTEYGIEVSDLVSSIPETEADMRALETYVLSKEMYVNALVSADAKYTVLIANIEDGNDEVAVAKTILDVMKETAGDHPYYFGGDPALSLYLDQYMTEDMTWLVPLMFLVMIVVLAVSFRRVGGVILPLIVVILGVLWTFGLQALFGIYANMLTPAVAVLLIAMGADYAVHIYNHFLKRGDVELSTREVTAPVVMSAVTTIAGLLTFATTKIDILKFFGIELAFGLGSTCLLSIFLLPICIDLFKAKAKVPDKIMDSEQPITAFSVLLSTIGGWVYRNAKLTLAITVILLVLIGMGIPRITTNVDFVDLLPEDCPPRRGNDIVKDHFAGIYPLCIYTRGDIGEPAVMQTENMIENYLRSQESLSGFTSINNLIAEENWLMNGVYAVPETREGIANLWLLLEGQEILKTFVSNDRDQSLISAMVKEPQTGVMKTLTIAADTFLEKTVSDTLVVLEREKLTKEGRKDLEEHLLSEAASQVAWLAQGYDKPNQYEATLFLEKLRQVVPGIEGQVDMSPLWATLREYLTNETIEVLPEPVIEKLIDEMKQQWPSEDISQLPNRLETLLGADKILSSDDAQSTVKGLLARARANLRLAKADLVWQALGSSLPTVLKENKDFRKRTKGVLWRLWSSQPILFDLQVPEGSGLEQAIVATQKVKIDQSGGPALFKRFDDLIFMSQLQSLGLASLIVLLLVSLTQRSFKRGIISLLSVLVPLGFILGLMGWFQIPLDFGTVLLGALIVGLGVDGSIHFLHYHHHLQMKGLKAEAALRGTMTHIGKAILTANGTTCCGFLMLLFSKTTALKNFSLVNALAIILVTVSIITFLPALVALFHMGEKVSEPM